MHSVYMGCSSASPIKQSMPGPPDPWTNTNNNRNNDNNNNNTSGLLRHESHEKAICLRAPYSMV